jgi:hypothetical protein
MRFAACIIFSAVSTVCLAQTWEVGGVAGAGMVRNVAVSNPSGSAAAGLATSYAAGFLLGQNLYGHVGGEIRYTFRAGNLRLAGGGAKATFSGQSHLFHYDVLLHTRPFGAAVRPFVAFGAGARMFRGTGQETLYQPLEEYALLTKTQQVTPVFSLGGGVKARLTPRVVLRLEFRDYVSPFPKQVIEPVIGSTLNGWLHDFVPMVSVSLVR